MEKVKMKIKEKKGERGSPPLTPTQLFNNPLYINSSN